MDHSASQGEKGLAERELVGQASRHPGQGVRRPGRRHSTTTALPPRGHHRPREATKPPFCASEIGRPVRDQVSARERSPALTASAQRAEELRGRVEYSRFAILVRRVSDARQYELLRPAAEPARYGVDLLERAVLVGLSLDEQRRSTDCGKATGEIPAAESGVQPGTVPSPEGRIDVLMPARETRA